MGQIAGIAAILVALGIQLWAARNPNRWYVWALYTAAALAAAYIASQTKSVRRGAAAPPRPDRQSSSSFAVLPRLVMLLLAAGAAALATEWSAATNKPVRALIAWVLTFSGLTAATWGMQVPHHAAIRFETPAQPPRRRAWLLHDCGLLVIFGAAVLLRVLWIDELPRVYFGDESRAGMFVRGAYSNGLPNLFTMGWNTWSMIGLSLQGMFAPCLGLNTVSVRLASVVFGSAAVLATYALTRELFDRRTALFAATLLAFNRTAIDFSRLGTTHAQAMLVESLTLYALWRAINTGSALAYAWAGMLAALCLHSYNAAHFVPFLLLGWLVLTASARPRCIRLYAVGALFALAGFILVAVPWLYYVTDHGAFTNNWLQYTWMARARQVTPQIIAAWHAEGSAAAARIFANHLWRTWLGFTAIPAEAYQLGYRGGGMLDHVSAALFVLGLPILFTCGARGGFVLYWWAATAFSGGVMTIDPPAFVRMVALIPAVCIVAACALRNLLKDDARSSAVVAAVVLGAVFVDNWRTYFVEFANSSADDTSELVHFVRHAPKESPVYLLGADAFLHFTHDVAVEQFAFDFPDRTLVDVAEPGRFLPIQHPNLTVPTYLVLAPSQLTMEPYIRHLYPHTAAFDARHRANGRLFFRYLRLAPDDLSAQEHRTAEHGLKVSYERDDVVVLERVDPHLNVFAVEGFFYGPQKLPIEAPYRARWNGVLEIDVVGTYSFEVDTSGPLRVEFGGERVCDLAGVVPENPKMCSFRRPLARGRVPLAVQWETVKSPNSSRQVLQLYWSPPNGSRELIPPDHFWPTP